MSHRIDTRPFAALIALATLLAAGGAHAHPPGAPAPSETPHFGIDDRTAATIEFLEERLAADPDDSAGLSRLGGRLLTVARATGRHEDLVRAEAVFRRLLALSPASRTARPGLAYCLQGRHRFREALEEAREASHLVPDAAEIQALLGDLHFALGNYAEAGLFYDRLHEQALTLESFARQALMHEHRGRLDEARQAMEHAIEAGRLLGAPGSSMAWCRTMLGDMAMRGGRLDEAEAEYTEALRLDHVQHVASWRLAQVANARGDFEAAQHVLRHLVEQYPKPAYWSTLGDAMAGLGDEVEARAWHDRAERHMTDQVDDGDLGHARELVELWLAHGGDSGRAVELALLDLRDVRRDVGAYATAAWALHHAGRHDEAASMIDAALLRSSSDPETLWRAGRIHQAAGHELRARQLLDRAARANPRLSPTFAAR